MIEAKNVLSHEQVNAITTRSGIATKDPPYPSHARSEVTKAKEKELDDDIPIPPVRPQSKDTERKSDEQAKFSLRVPYPQRLKAKDDTKEFKKFVDIFRKLQINIPFADAIAQMPKYAKFLRDLLSNRKRMDDFETVTLNEECSAVIQKALPKKLKDPGGFIIPVTLGDGFSAKALCDLGAGINLMPTSIYEQLGEDALTPTRMCLQMADRSLRRPRGVLEDVLVEVEGLIFPADFVILDMVADADVPIILGRPFMATGRTIIDVGEGKLTMRIEDEKVDFNVFESMKFPAYAVSDQCCGVEKAPPKPKEPGKPKKKKKEKQAMSHVPPSGVKKKDSKVEVHPVVKKIWAMKREEARRAKPP